MLQSRWCRDIHGKVRQEEVALEDGGTGGTNPWTHAVAGAEPAEAHHKVTVTPSFTDDKRTFQQHHPWQEIGGKELDRRYGEQKELENFSSPASASSLSNDTTLTPRTGFPII